ncbi:MAG: leucine-rich repeat domain-containing protein [Alphaproteobacteria bacterium]|nr:leucine-rich repeat domain-containing protein [Alphaproteobacteria bacterium]
MRKWVFVLGLVFSFNAFAVSDCQDGEQNCWDCGKTDSDLCTARRNGEELKITGTGEMRDYSWYRDTEFEGSDNPYGHYNGPWGYGETNVPWGYDYTSVSIEGIKSIGEYAFCYSSARNVEMSDSVTSIGVSAFDSSYSLENIKLSDNLKSIGKDAFAYNSYPPIGGDEVVISNFVIPDSVTSISEEIFTGANIKNLVIEGTPSIDPNAFYRIGNYSGEGHEVNIFCSNSDCDNKGQDTEAVNIIRYDKQGGVYILDGVYYLSGEKMLYGFQAENDEDRASFACNKALNECKRDVLEAKGICQGSSCDTFIQSDGQYMLKYNGKTYQSINDLLTGNYDKRRIYTIDEANFVAGDKNRVSIRYR